MTAWISILSEYLVNAIEVLSSWLLITSPQTASVKDLEVFGNRVGVAGFLKTLCII